MRAIYDNRTVLTTWQCRTDNSELSPSSICAKLSADQLVQSTNELGFEHSALFVELLQSVGNGGFRPGYGALPS